MCECGRCKCSQDLICAPKDDTPDVVRKYWAYASLLNACGKMIDGIGGHMHCKDLDDDTVRLITYVISALNAVEARVNNELLKQREERVNGKGKRNSKSG